MARTFSSFDPDLQTLIARGAVGVLPTDTVYGLAARAADQTAVARLYALKRRERKPGTLIAADAAQLAALGLDAGQLAVAATYWPGPLSVIIDCAAQLGYLHQGLGNVAARVPADEPLRRLLTQTGPLLTSSANQPGEPPATDLAEAERYFGNGVDFYVDGGRRTGPPSTIARAASGGRLIVVRQGAAIINQTEGNEQ